MNFERTISRILSFLVLSIFFLDFLSIKLRLVPRITTWMPDLLSIILFLVVLLLIAVQKKINISGKYLMFFAVYILHLLLGIIFNAVSPGPIFAGMRTYLRYLPIFFLPAVFNFHDKLMNRILKLLFYLSFLQVPLTIFQRFIQYRGVQTGDVVTGTLNIPSIVAIYQISVICFLIAMYMHKKITLQNCLLFCTILFIPCTINETKAVIILLPVSILAINFFAHGKKSIIRRFFVIPSIVVILIAIFIPIYDHFIQPKWGYGIIDFFKMEGRLEGYLYQGATGSEEEGNVKGRIDSINLAVKHISRDPLTLVFGLGMGNLTPSYIEVLKGKYADYAKLGAHITSLGNLIWEIGIIGALMFTLLFVMVFYDALRLRQASGLKSEIALAMIGIIAMFLLSLVYKNTIHHNISFLLWFFSAYVASENYKLDKEKSFEGADHLKIAR